MPSISSRLQLEESAISISRDFFGTMWKNQPQIARMEHASKSRYIAEVDSFIYLEKNDPLVVSHFCRRIDIVHLSQLWV